ncbi:sulfite exporter TauE/SafE family protein [Modestobacter lapidis]|nr:sulfite exporter TauE/SafE family protein [Modestobacter lapidis]
MTIWEMVAVVAAGFAAGGINAVVGSGTLVTFPVLLTVGLPPVTATVSNSIGLVTGSIAGIVGYRRELRGQRPLLVRLIPASVLGAVTGAFLLLNLPAEAFETIVPALVGLAVVLVLVQPFLQRALARKRARDGVVEPEQLRIGPGRLAGLLAGAYATGTYGGYFAASQGVLQIGIFGLLLPESLQRLNAMKNVLAGCVNAVAGLTYGLVASDRISWPAVGLVAVGSVAGGYVGSTFGRRLPPPVLRAAIVLLGLVAIGVLLSR